jgi:excisionase family DNA binding protein
MPTTHEPTLTVREVARYLDLSEDGVRRLIRSKRLKAFDISKTARVIYRVPQEALDEFQAVA